jgi:hypothetical protein
MPKKPMTEQERKRALDKGEISATEYSKLAYEESPYQDREKDSHMRNMFNSALNTAGAGRGKQGGPTAKELKKYEDKQDQGIYTAKMGQPPMDPEMAKKQGGVIKKMASGGSVSSRADGIAQRGKTRGKMC